MVALLDKIADLLHTQSEFKLIGISPSSEEIMSPDGDEIYFSIEHDGELEHFVLTLHEV